MINKTAIKVRGFIWKGIMIIVIILLFLMFSPIIIVYHVIAYLITAGMWLFNNKTFKETWNNGIDLWETEKFVPLFKPKFTLPLATFVTTKGT